MRLIGLSEEMYEDGYQHLTNIDISFTVIKQMQEMYKEKIPNLPFKQMDVRSLQYEDGTFDAVIDKGTFDSILCGDGSGPNADQMLSEIYRTLSPTGVYICISYGLPEQRMGYFQKSEFYWNVFQHKIAKPTISTSAVVAKEDKDEKNFHYIYVMRKQVEAKDKQ
jgi:ubiquinone/menaquinone biosynthesis C-methylase UbiE